MELKRRGYETRLVLPSGDPSPPPQQSVIRLRDALKQALTWHAALTKGKVRSVASLAAREKLDEAHVRRRLQLAYLAPDLMQAIIDGTLPPECSPTQLRQGIPLDWREQRRILGSAATGSL